MKTGIISMAILAGAEPVANRSARDVRNEEKGEKRYAQLADMMHYFNNDFDERKYWTYGCNCLMLGDRPMSDPGLGPPIDGLDGVCKAYKDCNKCTKQKFGAECIGEFIKYKFTKSNGQINCEDPEGTCQRSICMCDAKFAGEHAPATELYNPDYHRFYSTIGWDAEQDCPKSGGSQYLPECCGGDSTPFLLYNAHRFECCPDGSTAPQGGC